MDIDAPPLDSEAGSWRSASVLEVLAMIWAGIAFYVVGHRDGRMLRLPGLFAFCRGDPDGDPLMLFAGQAQDLAAAAGPGHPAWPDALALGMDELHVHLSVGRRIDRLQLLARVVRHVEPLLNLVDEANCPIAAP